MPHIPVLIARFAGMNVVEPTEWWTRSRERQRQRLPGCQPEVERQEFGARIERRPADGGPVQAPGPLVDLRPQILGELPPGQGSAADLPFVAVAGESEP